MNINRYNYEEFFLLYVDGELNVSQRKEVEEFVEQNPDLEEELSMLKQSVLKPNHSIVMENKSILLKNDSAPFITVDNYETFFLLYVDEELNAEERRAVETFASEHPSLQAELQLLMQTRLQADEKISFPDKNILYKVPAVNRTSVVRMYRMAAIAVVLILALGIYWLAPTHDKINSGGVIVKTNTPKATLKPETKESVKKAEVEQVTRPELIAVTKKTVGSAREKMENAKNKKVVEPINAENSQELATFTPDAPDASIPPAAIPSTTVLAMNMQTTTKVPTTLIVDQPVEQTRTDSRNLLTREEGISDEDPSSVQTKGKLRGFLRQVKRVVDKTTRLPGEETKKLLKGNIEIALK